MNQLLTAFTVTLLPSITFSLSVCDELDVNFVLSTESLLSSLSNIKGIMTQVMEEGTSDFTDHKVMLFGSNVPSKYQHAAIPVIDLNLEILDEMYLDLTSNPVDDAIDIKATEVIHKHHTSFVGDAKAHHKQQRFKESVPSVPEEGAFTEYIIFAISTSESAVMNDISHSRMHCANDFGLNLILNAVNSTKHRRYTMKDHASKCDIHVFWDTHLLDDAADAKAMTLLNAITCKAKVYDDDGNEIILNHQSHFVDPDSYIDCHFVYKSDQKVSNELDEEESYIHVVDGANAYTKYKKGNYMIVTRDEMDDLPVSCRSGGFVYKIMDILPMENDVLKLRVKSPRSPHEYIYKSKFATDVKLPSVDQNELRRQLWWLYYNDSQDVYDNTWTKADSYSVVGIDISYGAFFGIDINAYLFLDWDWWTENEVLEFRIYGSYSIGFYFQIQLQNEIVIPFGDIINFVGSSIVYTVGVLPIWLRPYFNIGATLTILLPLQVRTGLNCTHKSTFNQGYRYNRTNSYQPPFGLLSDNWGLDYSVDSLGTGYSLESCAQNIYYHQNADLDPVWELGDCEYFGFKSATGECVCYLHDSVLWDKTKSIAKDGWALYVLGNTCSGQYTSCDTFGFGCTTGVGDFVLIEGAACGYTGTAYTYTCATCSLLDSLSGAYNITFHEKYISESEVVENGCTRYFNVLYNDEGGFCDTLKYDDRIGFDLEIQTVIGVLFYSIFDVYSRIPILNEFRVQPIEMDPGQCYNTTGLSADADMCALDSIYLSSELNISFSLYLGARIALEEAFSDAITFAGDNPGTQYAQDNIQVTDPQIEFTILEGVHIAYINLGCLAVNDISSTLNDFLSNMCCTLAPTAMPTTSPTAPTAPTIVAVESTLITGPDASGEESPEGGGPGNSASKYDVNIALFAFIQCIILMKT